MHHKYAWKALRVQWAQHQSANLCFDLYFERFPWKWEASAYFGCQTTTFGVFSVNFLCWDAKTKQFHNCLAKIMEICPQSRSTEKYLWINITKGFTTFPKGPQHQGQMAGGERVNGKHMLCFCLYKVFAFCLYKCIVQGCYWHRGTTLPMQC